MDKRKALGRGLGALIPSLPRVTPPQAPADGGAGAAVHQIPADGGTGGMTNGMIENAAATRSAVARREFFLCPIEEIAPSRDNPRHRFDEQRLQELADSIRAQGLVQPLVVRLRSGDELRKGEEQASFVLIAGERRWRAAQKAGLKDVPVVVKDVNAAAAFELALVENLQREDLNPIEEAEAYRRLSEEFGYTQDQLAQRVGRERSTVANALRLLKLPDKVRDFVATSRLSMGHARALLSLEAPESIERSAQHVMDRQLSVRQTEDLVRKAAKTASEPEAGPDKRKQPPEKTASVRDVESRLRQALGARVELRQKDPKSGFIEIYYHSLDELDGLIERLTGQGGD